MFCFKLYKPNNLRNVNFSEGYISAQSIDYHHSVQF